MALAALWPAIILAAPDDGSQAQGHSSRIAETGKRAGEIASQPARDIGAVNRPIPPVLVAAAHDPYSLDGTKSCRQLGGAIKALNEALGPDFKIDAIKKENRAGKLAEAGGKTVINAFIPFRGLVREISGAAPAERRMNVAIDAGYARRGFLRGIHHSRGCRPI
jgi:hypothetical protein